MRMTGRGSQLLPQWNLLAVANKPQSADRLPDGCYAGNNEVLPTRSAIGILNVEDVVRESYNLQLVGLVATARNEKEHALGFHVTVYKTEHACRDQFKYGIVTVPDQGKPYITYILPDAPDGFGGRESQASASVPNFSCENVAESNTARSQIPMGCRRINIVKSLSWHTDTAMWPQLGSQYRTFSGISVNKISEGFL